MKIAIGEEKMKQMKVTRTASGAQALRLYHKKMKIAIEKNIKIGSSICFLPIIIDIQKIFIVFR